MLKTFFSSFESNLSYKLLHLVLLFALNSHCSVLNFLRMGSKIPRGAFILFEGCDRSGKSTQCKKLVQYLNEELNIPAKYVNFPDRTTSTGVVINEYLHSKIELSDQAAHLLFSANRWEREPELRKLLQQGTTLIVDRYSFSGVAFSAAKEGMNLSWCFEPEKGLPKPDIVLLLKLNEEAMMKRKGFGDERYEKTDFQRKVAENYEILKDDSWLDVDADKTIDELASHIQNIAKDVIKKSQFSPLQNL